MNRLRMIWALAAPLAALGSSAAGQDTRSPATELARLLHESRAPARFRDHKPQFDIRQQKFTFEAGGRKFEETYFAIVDGARYVALCDPNSTQVEVLASTPDLAPTKLELSAPLGIESRSGTRLKPEIRLNGRALEIDQQDCHFSKEEGAAVVVFRQEWSLPRKGHSTSIFRFRCDPVRGYGVELSTEVSLAPEPAKKNAAGDIIGVLAFKPGRIDDPWPASASPYDRVVYTQRNGAGFSGWWNNPATAPRLHGRDDFLSLRAAGFLTYLGPQGTWLPTVSYPDPSVGGPLHRIDPSTLEQQCYLVRPAPAEGAKVGPLMAQIEFGALPPEAGALLSQRADFSQWESKRAVMVRLGRAEDFEEQPLPLASGARGLLSPAYVLSTKEAHSGKNSLVLLGTPANRQAGAKPQVAAPRLPLDPRSRYRLTVWAKSASGTTEGLVSLALHPTSDLDDDAARRLRTPGAKTGEGWKELTLEFETGQFLTYADLRFQAIGTGAVYFDDFSFTKLNR